MSDWTIVTQVYACVLKVVGRLLVLCHVPTECDTVSISMIERTAQPDLQQEGFKSRIFGKLGILVHERLI
jgi:hypothetical protein